MISAEASKTNRKPKLTHGDLRLKNVITNEAGAVKAILDWENCTSNAAPEWELPLALHDLGIDEKQEFLEGYDLPAKNSRKSRRSSKRSTSSIMPRSSSEWRREKTKPISNNTAFAWAARWIYMLCDFR